MWPRAFCRTKFGRAAFVCTAFGRTAFGRTAFGHITAAAQHRAPRTAHRAAQHSTATAQHRHSAIAAPPPHTQRNLAAPRAQVTCMPILSRIVSLFAQNNELESVAPR